MAKHQVKGAEQSRDRSTSGAKLHTCSHIAGYLQDWLKKVGIQPIQIYPGSPWESGYNERFNGTLRREVLNAEWFHSTRQAQGAINLWLRQYNRVRPHHALNMRPPVPETFLEKTQITGTETGGWTVGVNQCSRGVTNRPKYDNGLYGNFLQYG
ncbi:transposase [Leisingera sp. JC1]|uniref:transposase n=1 Tax=Leisingera sp. JC1 TaxID=1855282 RepID=UPI0034A0B4D9